MKYVKLPIPDPVEPKRTSFDKAHIRGLEKLGMVLIAESADMPPFADVQAAHHLNGMIDYMYDDDRSSILVILKIFAVLPAFLIRWIMSLIEAGAKWNGMVGAPFRMLRIGLKGLIFTIYYSDFTTGQTIHAGVGYDAKICM